MTLSHELVTLNGIAKILTVPENQEISYSSELSISIQNLDTSKVAYIGDANVTSSSYGYRLDPYQTITLDLKPRDEIYAISGNGSSQVAIIRVGH